MHMLLMAKMLGMGAGGTRPGREVFHGQVTGEAEADPRGDWEGHAGGPARAEKAAPARGKRQGAARGTGWGR